MGKYTQELRILNRDFLKIYDPKTALTNPELGEINQKIQALQQSMEGKEECSNCSGWGDVECNECGHENECRDCEGTGLVEKK